MAARRAIETFPLRDLRRCIGVLSLSVVALCVALPSAAQDRATLARLLREGEDFRVRVQAAFAIGNTRDPIMRPQLERALGDEHEAVRAAAATALGRLGSPRALPALRRALRDRSSAVRTQAQRAIETLEGASAAQPAASPSPAGSALQPLPQRIDWSRVRAALVMGDMRNRSQYAAGRALEQRFRSEVRAHLGRLTRVVVFENDAQITAESRSQLQRRRVPMLRLDGSLTSVEPSRGGPGLSVRCEVSLMLLEEPGRNLRGMLRGSATGMDRTVRDRRQQEARLAEEALSGAVRSAMSTADVAIARAARQ